MSYSFVKYLISALSCVLIVACQPPPEPEKPKGILRIATVPADMPILVDGQPKGNSPSGDGQFFSISLEEGDHTISIFQSIDDEKEQYFEKDVYVAADTVQIITLEAEERLTPFGEKEKLRREVEAADKLRVAENERKKAAEKAAAARAKIKKEARTRTLKFRKINKEHSDYLNEVTVKYKNLAKASFKVDGCNLTLSYDDFSTPARIGKVDAGDLIVFDSHEDDYARDEYNQYIYYIKCKGGKECIDIGDNVHTDNLMTHTVMYKPEVARIVDAHIVSVIKNCQR